MKKLAFIILILFAATSIKAQTDSLQYFNELNSSSLSGGGSMESLTTLKCEDAEVTWIQLPNIFTGEVDIVPCTIGSALIGVDPNGTIPTGGRIHSLATSGTEVRKNIVYERSGIGAAFATQLSTNASSNPICIIGNSSIMGNSITIESGGNLGVGTYVPTQKLDVAGSIKASGLAGAGNRMVIANSTGVLSSQAQPTLSIVGTSLSISNGNSVTIPGDNLGNHTATQNVRLNGNWLSNDGGNEGIAIDNTGRVGISAAPGTGSIYLNVGGYSYLQQSVGIGTTPVSNHILFANGNCQFGFTGIGGSFDATLSDKLKVHGNMSSTGNLSVTGTTTLSGHVTINDDVTVNGSGTYTGSWTNSDLRYKNNIEPISNSLEKVLQLKGVKYNFNQEKFPEINFSNAQRIGFIAQELKEVFPEAVRQKDDGYFAVNYEAIIPVLVEAIKEQQLLINQQSEAIQNCSTRGATSSRLEDDTNNDINSLGFPNEAISESLYLGKLYQNKPNPFSNTTVIEYETGNNATYASILVFDMQGKQLKRFDNLSKGFNSVTINASELYAGMFMYSLIVDGKEIATKRMILN